MYVYLHKHINIHAKSQFIIWTTEVQSKKSLDIVTNYTETLVTNKHYTVCSKKDAYSLLGTSPVSLSASPCLRERYFQPVPIITVLTKPSQLFADKLRDICVFTASHNGVRCALPQQLHHSGISLQKPAYFYQPPTI